VEHRWDDRGYPDKTGVVPGGRLVLRVSTDAPGRGAPLRRPAEDEYWSAAMREHTERFARCGGNVAFFGGNTCWWQVEFDDESSFRRVATWSDPAGPDRPDNLRLAELGYQPEFGARLLRPTIQREIDNRLSGLLLAGKLGPGSHVMVDVHDGEFDIQSDSADETAAQAT
jgi:hypothetical protein